MSSATHQVSAELIDLSDQQGEALQSLQPDCSHELASLDSDGFSPEGVDSWDWLNPFSSNECNCCETIGAQVCCDACQNPQG